MLYAIAHVIVSFLARWLFKFQVIGHENIPKSDGVIIASNHLSYIDIPLLGCGVERRVDFMGKKELFRIPIISLLFRILGGFPVDRDKVDRTALREAVKRLKAGRVVAIFPEGRRSLDGRLQPGRAGIGLIVRMSGKKVVPAAIKGTDNVMPAGKWRIRTAPVTIKFGRPLDFSGLMKKRSDNNRIEDITKIIMDNIAALLETG